MEFLKKHMLETLSMRPDSADGLLTMFARHPDIAAELKNYIQTGSFPTENAIRAENYTAQEIAAMAPHLKDVGIYVFLISLREDPVGAKEVIAEGFMRK